MRKDFFKDYGFKILFVVVFLLSFIWMGTKQTIMSNSNAVEDWLPAQHKETRDYRWYLQQFPFESYVVISWEGCELDDDRVELFAQKLVPEQTIDNFTLAAPTETFRAELKIANEPEDSREEMRDVSGVSPNASTQALLDASAAEVADAPSKTSADENYFKSVMTGPRLVRLLRQAYERTERPSQTANATTNEDGLDDIEIKIRERLKGTLIGPDGKSTALIVTLRSGTSSKSISPMLDKIRKISTECGLPDTTKVQTGSIASRMVQNFLDMCDEIANGRKVRMDGVIMGGPPVDNVALNDEGQRTLFRLAALCAVIGVTIALLCLQSVRLTLFVFWVALLSAGCALAFVSLTGSTCDTILLSMPALVYVLGMSGAIHLINYYHDAIRESGLSGATERAVRHAFTPCFFAQLTTAIGLGSLFLGRLVPITKFGFYSAIGVLFTLLLLFLYLPALLYFYPSKKFAEKHGGKGLEATTSKLHRLWNFLGGLIIRRHNVVVCLCLAMMVFFGYHLVHIKTSVKMMDFFSKDAEIIRFYSWLEDKLGPLVPMELVVCFDNDKLYDNSYRTAERLELVQRISDRIQKELSKDVGGSMSVGLFTPDISEMATRGGATYRAVSTVVGKTINENRDALRDYLAVEGDPSLEEFTTYLKESAEQKRAEFEEELVKFEESVEGLTDADGKPLKYEAFHSLDPNDLAENVVSYYAKYQKLETLEKTAIEYEKEYQAVVEADSYLREQKALDLDTILDATKEGKSFRRLSLEENALLRKGAIRWQNEKGIELWRVSIRVWSLRGVLDYSEFIEKVKNVVEPIIAEESLRITTTLAGEDFDAKWEEAQKYVDDNLPPEGQKTKKAKDKKTLLHEYVVKESGVDENELQLSMGESHDTDKIYPAGIAMKYTGMVPLVYQTEHELINGLTSSLIMAFVLIMIVFVFLLRSFPASLIAMLPNIFPVVVVFGFMGWIGVQVDVGTMMTASVALGVAVDDTMHYLTWFSDGIGQGMTPKQAALNAYRRCAAAMTESTLIAGLGLFSFAFSTFVPTQRFGIMMLAILATAEFGDLVFLPALLTCSPFGRFFNNRRVGLRSRKDEKPVAEPQKA